MATILVVCNEKGGVGKSTLAINISVLLRQKGVDVALVDADKAGRAIQWHSFRKENEINPFLPTYHMVGKIAADVVDLSKRHDIVVVDIGASVGDEMLNAMTVADHILVPVRPSSMDLTSIETMIGLIRSIERRTGRKPIASIAVNCASTNPSLHEAEETIEVIKSDSEISDVFRVNNTIIYDRVIYRRTYTNGLGVAESTDKKASEEIESLIKEILQ